MKANSKAKSVAERQRDYRERNRKRGLVMVRYWVHPSQRARLAKYVARLDKEREKSAATP